MKVSDFLEQKIRERTEVLEARDAWLAAAKKHKKPVPEPRYRAAIYAVPA